MSRHRTPARTRRRSGLAAAVAAVLLGTLVPAGPASAAGGEHWVSADGKVVIDGHGYGHGRGMSQYGARGAARSGVGWRDILAFYYPGTTLGTAGGSIRVLLTAYRGATLRVTTARRLRVRDLQDGRSWPLRPPTASTRQWELRENAKGRLQVRYLDDRGWHGWRVPVRGTLRGEGELQAAEPLTLADTGASYRERLRTARSSGRLQAVNVLGIERYIRGVVPREMPASWETNALRAQAVAARTYAVRHRNANPRRYYNVDDTISYQVYGGVQGEAPTTNRAIADTAGTVVHHRGSPALTEFSSSSGGWTAGSSLAYQVVKKDPYEAPSGNPNTNWTQQVDAGTLESRFPSLGDLVRIDVTGRNGGGQWGGRVDGARLVGTGGSVALSGNDLRMTLGLRSAWLRVRDTTIIALWRRLGGSSSPVGSPTAAEYLTSGGTAQRFERGRIYHHERTGARETHGPIAALYTRRRGASGFLGFPRTHVRSGAGGVAGAQLQNFQRGRIYFHPAIGAREVHGPILSAYHARRSASGPLGFPRTHVRTVNGGLRSDFQGGYIRWFRSTGRTRVVLR